MAGNVRVVLKSVFDDKGIRDAQNEFAKVGKTVGVAFAAVGAAVGVATAGIIKFSSKSVDAASNLNESLNAIKVAYGDASGEIAKLGEDAATRLGVTQTAFNQAAVRFSAFAERIVGDGGNVTRFIDDITTRAADFASVFNIDVAEALQVFQSGLAGEAEPLKRFGINLLESEVKAYAMANGIGAVGKELTETEKVQARYGLLMESTAKTQGDFANTSTGLANSQRILQASFTDLQAAVGKELTPTIEGLMAEFINLLPTLREALIPAAQTVAETFSREVVPAIKDFTGWLASPQGTQTVKNFVGSIVDGIKGLLDFAKGVFENIDQIKTFAVLTAGATVALKTMETAIGLARAAQLLFNVAVKANPYILAATALIALAGGMTAVMVATKDSTSEFDTNKMSVDKLNEELRKLKAAYEDGLIPTNKFIQKQAQLEAQLRRIKNQAAETAGELNRYNNLQSSDIAKRANDAWARSWVLRGEAAKAAAEKEKAAQSTTTTTATTKTVDKAKETFDKVQKLIRATQKSIADAQEDYDKTVAKATKDNLEAQIKIRQDYAEKVEKIILDSQKRLTDAFRSATSVDIGKLFSDTLELQKDATEDLAKNQEELAKATLKLKQEQEDLNAVLLDPKATKTQITAAQRAYDAAKADVDKLSADIKKIRTTSDPVTGLVESLRSRLQSANELIARTAALAAEGFSQTFLEQVVATGAETGNQMAAAILDSTPETKAELKRLFAAVESTSERGMTELARTIYEQQGLATRELRELYKQADIELTKALGDQQVAFQRSLEEAAVALGEKLRDIKADFAEDVEELGGAYGGLKGVIDGVTRSLDTMIGKADSAARAAANAAITAATATQSAISEITGQPGSQAATGGTSAGAEGLRGFGDPGEMRRLAALQAAGTALGGYSQSFINMVLGQRSFVKDGVRTSFSGDDPARAAELIAQGFVEEFGRNIDKASLDLALSLAEQVYGVDIGGISTPGQIGGNTFNITVNAGMGTDPITVGREIVDAIKRFERSSGQVFVGV